MAKAKQTNKQTKPRERLFRWRATLIKGTPAKFLGHVDAPDEETARRQAAKEVQRERGAEAPGCGAAGGTVSATASV